MSDKSTEAFRTISEVAKELGLATHVLRFWESKFPQIKPLKRAGGRRYYRPDDVDFLRRLQVLLHDEGYTIKGAQKLIREEGTRRLKEQGAELAAKQQDNSLEGSTSTDSPVFSSQDQQTSLFDTPKPTTPASSNLFSALETSETPFAETEHEPEQEQVEEPVTLAQTDVAEEAADPEPELAPEPQEFTPPKFFLPEAPEPTTIPEPEAIIHTEIVEKMPANKKERLTEILEELEEMQRLLSEVA